MHPNGEVCSSTALIGSTLDIMKSVNINEISCRSQVEVIVEVWNVYITISAVYSPPKYVIKSKQYITFLETLGNYFIVAEDYNAKYMQWGRD